MLSVLIGPPGSGKTTMADALTAATSALVVSLDQLRARLSPWGDESDQAVTAEAVRALHTEVHHRLEAGEHVLVDATNSTRDQRAPLLELARATGALSTALVLLPPLPVCLARNGVRDSSPGECGYARCVPPGVVAAMHTEITHDLPTLHAEGWDHITILEGPTPMTVDTAEAANHHQAAADLARREVNDARTETTRAVDAAGKLITALGALGAVGGTLGTLAIKGHSYIGGALLLIAGFGMFVAFDRAVSVIQARIPTPKRTSPGWLGLLAVPRAEWAQHYRVQAADLITTCAAETDVIGRIAHSKHRRNRITAVLIRWALVVGVVGAACVALGF